MSLLNASEIDFSGFTRDLPQQPINPVRDEIVFQQITADYHTAETPTSRGVQLPVVRLFGLTEEGRSLLVHVHGFRPYFYASVPSQSDESLDAKMAEVLDRQLKLSNVGRKLTYSKLITKVERKKCQTMYGYQPDTEGKDYLRISTVVPELVATARRILQSDGLHIEGRHVGFEVFECNIPYALRYMVDKDIVGGGWCSLPAGRYFALHKRMWSHEARSVKKTPGELTAISRCQLEVDIMWHDLVSHTVPISEVEQSESQGTTLAEAERWMKLAPQMRVLSFDIECLSQDGGFPQPRKDPVIQIACVMSPVNKLGDTGAATQVVFTLGTCASIPAAAVYCFDREEELLKAFAKFVCAVDPDLLTGYNINNFDWPYLIDRAAALKLHDFAFAMPRIISQAMSYKDTRFQSSGLGNYETKQVTMAGRVQFDAFLAITRDYKLHSYSLNSVAQHFLKQSKDDVHYSQMAELQAGDASSRCRLARYCLKDALLPIQLLHKLMYIVNYVEMARVTGVPISYLLERGQQIKVTSQLLRKGRQKRPFLIMPYRARQANATSYEGATVFEPLSGFYAEPVTTLDFASLYPSIMMAHNLCFTTLLTAKQVRELNLREGEDYTKTPENCYFATQSTKPGLLPEVLSELLSARRRAKKDMKAATDPLAKAVLNGRQLALKISANSVYGYTDISASITGFGREMIEQTKRAVEEKYCQTNGYPFDAQVVYGDTDSVMVKFGYKDVEKSMQVGREAAEFVTKLFKQPIKLEFEKVYFPFLLFARKRYAAMLYSKSHEKPDYMDCKGIEVVRRDNCALVRDVMQTVLDKILIERDVDGAVTYTQSQIKLLLTNRIDLSKLVLSKSLQKQSGTESSYKAGVFLLPRRT
ncbi:MAG: hypothetical protein MHM6MM_005471 [Cercozoa sp. M6MM]